MALATGRYVKPDVILQASKGSTSGRIAAILLDGPAGHDAPVRTASLFPAYLKEPLEACVLGFRYWRMNRARTRCGSG